MTLAGCTAVVLWVPVRVPATELPALVVTRTETRAAVQNDRALAAAAPHSAEARALRSIVREGSIAEMRREGEARHEARLRAAAAARRAVAAHDGPRAIAALRAEATLAFDRLAENDLPRAEQDAVGGRFLHTLERYGAARDGAVVAPPLVARTLFKARWNAMVDLPLTSGLGRAERRAYWGWLALHADRAPDDLRVRAFVEYERLRGPGAEEARAILLAAEGLPESSADTFFALHRRTGGIRYRNHAAAAFAAPP